MKTERFSNSTAPGRCLAALSLLPLLVTTGCGTAETGDATATVMDAERLQDLAVRYTAAWSSGDPVRVAAFYSEDGSLTVNDGEPATGREAITGVARGFMTTFPDMAVMMDSLRVAPETIEYHWTFTGTNTAPGGTGNAVRISGYEEWTLAESGLIAASKGHYDEAEYRRQLESGVGSS